MEGFKKFFTTKRGKPTPSPEAERPRYNFSAPQTVQTPESTQVAHEAVRLPGEGLRYDQLTLPKFLNGYELAAITTENYFDTLWRIIPRSLLEGSAKLQELRANAIAGYDRRAETVYSALYDAHYETHNPELFQLVEYIHYLVMGHEYYKRILGRYPSLSYDPGILSSDSSHATNHAAVRKMWASLLGALPDHFQPEDAQYRYIITRAQKVRMLSEGEVL